MSPTHPHSKSRPAQTVGLGNLSFWILGNLYLASIWLNFPFPEMPGNVCRKGLMFPEIPGNLNLWNCNIILMTVNEAYLDAPGANVTLNYILVMTLRLHDTFPSNPYTFPGHICPFPWLLLLVTLIFYPHILPQYKYFHQKKSRKWTNMLKKCVRSTRRSRKPVWGSRKREQTLWIAILTYR